MIFFKIFCCKIEYYADPLWLKTMSWFLQYDMGANMADNIKCIASNKTWIHRATEMALFSHKLSSHLLNSRWADSLWIEIQVNVHMLCILCCSHTTPLNAASSRRGIPWFKFTIVSPITFRNLPVQTNSPWVKILWSGDVCNGGIFRQKFRQRNLLF